MAKAYLDKPGLTYFWGKIKGYVDDRSYGGSINERTVVAPLVSFDDGAEDIPIVKLETAIEPVQDLHGYDAPWPGGGGKNVLQMTVAGIKAANTDKTWNGNSTTVSGVTFTIQVDGDGNVVGINVNGTATANAILNIGTYALASGDYYLSGCPTGGSGSTYYLDARNDNSSQVYDSGQGRSITSSGQSGKLSRIVVYSGVTMSNKVFKPMIRLASASATFEPYSNICPISGRNEITIKRTGKNLLQIVSVTRTTSGITYTVNKDENGRVVSVTASGTATANAFLYLSSPDNQADNVVDDFSNLVGQSMTITGCPSGGSTSTYRIMVSNLNTGSSYANDIGEGATFTMQSGTIITIRIASGTSISTPITFKPMLRLASDSDATFAPYRGTTYIYPLSDTIYGGTFDAATGVLTVTHGYVDLGSLDWSHRGEISQGIFSVQNPFEYKLTGDADAICSLYKYGGTVQSVVGADDEGDKVLTLYYVNGSSTRAIYVYDTAYNNASDFKTAMSGVQLVYELANPFTVQLDVPVIKALQGHNNIWSDIDGDLTVKYCADGTFTSTLKKYVELYDSRDETIVEDAYLSVPTNNVDYCYVAYKAGYTLTAVVTSDWSTYQRYVAGIADVGNMYAVFLNNAVSSTSQQIPCKLIWAKN